MLESENQQAAHNSSLKIQDPSVQLVVFRLGEQAYACYGEWIQEILPVGKITYVPGTPEHILGVMNVRGEIESVLDLQKAFSSLTSPITKRSRILIGEVPEGRSGIVVDAVENVLEIPEASIHAPEMGDNSDHSEYTIAECMYNEQTLMVLDVAKIFEHLLS